MIDDVLTNRMNDLLSRSPDCTGIPTVPKIYSEFRGARHGAKIGVFRSERTCPREKRETGKNYIGLLSDEIEEQRTIEVQSATDRRVKEYFVGLVAAMFNRRRSEAR